MDKDLEEFVGGGINQLSGISLKYMMNIFPRIILHGISEFYNRHEWKKIVITKT